MKERPAPRKSRISRGPRAQVVCRAGAPLVIDALLPDSRHRPVTADVPTLEHFCEMMAAQGYTAHLSRLAFDRIYARERCTFAQRNGDRPLRMLAATLMGHYLKFTPAR